MELTLPLPPSVNHQYATVNGRRILSARGRSFKQLVAQQILLAMTKIPRRQHLLESFQSEFLGLTVRFHFPNLLRRDIDGGLKITQDAVCEALGINDNRILHIHLLKARDPHVPRMEVSLFRMGAESTSPSSPSPRH
jgi:crossover junction endodeoxyribonuclease RusA